LTEIVASRIGGGNLTKMGGWPDHLRNLNSWLREYELLLREYTEIKNDSNQVDTPRAAQLESELRSRGKRIEDEQSLRDDGFGKVVRSADRAWGGTPFLSSLLRDFRRDLPRVPNFNLPGFDDPFRDEQRFLEHAIARLEEELKSRGVLTEQPDHVERVASEIRQAVEIEARLRRQCEEEVTKYPEQEESIRRSYRRAIDALRES
jgi:hypothetical protein